MKGFTIVELLVTMVIFATLIGLATINLAGAKQRTSLNTSVEVLVNDLAQQQLKAMTGDTEGRSSPDLYGIHFNNNKYILFHGTVFNSSDTSNFTVNLGDNITFTQNFPDVIFQRVNGETGTSGSITLLDNTTKTQKSINYNRYGVVTGIN